MGNEKQFFNRVNLLYKNFYFSEISLILRIEPLETCPIMVYFYMQSLRFEPMHFLKIWEQPI